MYAMSRGSTPGIVAGAAADRVPSPVSTTTQPGGAIATARSASDASVSSSRGSASAAMKRTRSSGSLASSTTKVWPLRTTPASASIVAMRSRNSSSTRCGRSVLLDAARMRNAIAVARSSRSCQVTCRAPSNSATSPGFCAAQRARRVATVSAAELTTSLRKVRGADDVAITGNLVLQHRGELGLRAVDRLEADRLYAAVVLGGAHLLLDRVRKRLDQSRWRARRREHAVPLRQVDVRHAALRERRHIGQ